MLFCISLREIATTQINRETKINVDYQTFCTKFSNNAGDSTMALVTTNRKKYERLTEVN
jgi:hypothetical protein